MKFGYPATLLMFFVLALMPKSASGQPCSSRDGITVSVEAGRGTCVIHAISNGRYDIDLTVNNPSTPSAQAATFQIRTNNTSRVLGVVTLIAAPNRAAHIDIGTSTTRFAGVSRVSESGTGTSVLDALYITGNVGDSESQTTPSIVVDQVITIAVNGTRPQSGNILGGISTGSIFRIDITSDIRGDITAASGGAEIINAYNIYKGTSQNQLPLTIQCAGSISNLTAQYVNANINTRYNGANGSILSMNCANSLLGSIDTYAIGTLPNSLGLVVGLALEADVTTASGGLLSQVIVNQGNGVYGWTGKFTVGSTILDGVEYSQTSSSLGGGAVGAVRYNLHREDSSPIHDGYRLISQFSAANPVRVSYYGPLARRAGTVDSLLATVEYHVPYTPFEENADPQAPQPEWRAADPCFTVSIDPTNPRRLLVKPNPEIPAPPAPGLYRLTATADLVCGAVPSAPAVRPRTYLFWLALDCNDDGVADADDFTPNDDPTGDCNHNGVIDCCDIFPGNIPGQGCTLEPEFCDGFCNCNFNQDDFLNSQDFFDFLSCFLADSCPQGRTADINQDDVVNSQDFFDFLSCFFSGC